MRPALNPTMVRLLSLLAFAAGAIHLAITPYHVDHSPAHGIFFALVGALQLALALALWLRPAPRLLAGGALLSGSLVVLWGVSELFPIPYDHAHSTDWAAFATKGAELLFFALALGLLAQAGRRAFTFALLPVLGGLAIYGVAVAQAQAGWFVSSAAAAASHPHTHADDHSHAADGHTHAESDDPMTAHEGGQPHEGAHTLGVAPAATGVAAATVAPTAAPNPIVEQAPAGEGLQAAGLRTYELSGESETISDPFDLPAGFVLFEFEHPADTPFAFFLLDSESNHLTMPANHLHGLSGMGVYNVRAAGQYRLHTIAEDGWKITVTPLDSAALRANPAPLAPLSGGASYVTPPTRLEAGDYEWTWSHKGMLGFEVTLLNVAGGERVNALQLTGAGQGSARVTVPESGVYLLYIFADGDWTLTP